MYRLHVSQKDRKQPAPFQKDATLNYMLDDTGKVSTGKLQYSSSQMHLG